MSRRDPDQLLGHADENDGIEEYDNPLPDWWLGLFLFTVVWAVGYTLDYHVISDRSQTGVYANELAAAEAKWPKQEASADLSAADLAEGKAIYDSNCLGCHGPELKGGIGPNLTDSEWIHGGSFDEVVTVITNGVLEKGMLAWGPILGPQRIGKVAGYVLSQNTGEAPAAAAAPVEGTPDAPAQAAAAALPVPPAGSAAEQGLAVFTTNCVACHGADLKGGVGPNLVDDEWIHGSTEEAIVKVVTDGVLEKGMIAWGPILGEEKIAQVTAYILHVNSAPPSNE